MNQLTLSVTSHVLAVCRLANTNDIPLWALQGEFASLTRTPDELSIVCRESDLPPGRDKVERGWRCLKVEGPLDFGLTGILASIAQPLAEAKVSIFAISTFDTDYVLVKQEKLAQAIEVLRQAGHRVQESVS